MLDTVRRDLPMTGSAALATTRQGGGEEKPSSRARDATPQVRFPETPQGSSCDGGRRRQDVRDLRCGPFTGSGGRTSGAQPVVTVGAAGDLRILLGHAPSAAARAALAAGGAVALRSDLAPGGRVSIDWFTPKQLAEYPVQGPPVRVDRLDAVVDLPEHPLQAALYVTPATAHRLHLRAFPDRILLDLARTPTSAELDRVNTAVSASVNQPGATFVSVEHGPTDYGGMIAWWVLLACLVIAIAAGATAIGLARVDGKADDATFAALGAPPRIRRGVAAVQALLMCGVGAVIGTVLGLVPAAAIGSATQSFAFAPPVPQLVLTAVGIPAVIAVGSALLISRRTDLARRPAVA